MKKTALPRARARYVAACALLAAGLPVAAPALAGPGWNGPEAGTPAWGRDPWQRSGWNRDSLPDSRRDDAREGRVSVARFTTPDPSLAALLKHGAIAVASESASSDYLVGSARAPYEAAIVDQLVAAGYDTVHARPDGGQKATVRIVREVLTPAEARRNPVSGSAAMSVSNRGNAYGLAVNVDMTKPRTALVSTRIEARIVDVASGKSLWEGRAEIATREGDAKWTDQTIATKLATALFDGFPADDGPADDAG